MLTNLTKILPLFGFLIAMIWSNLSFAAVHFSEIDFWTLEHLENRELRGGRVYQLNTRPVLQDSVENDDQTADSGLKLYSMQAEYSFSSLLPVIQNREGAWISSGNNIRLTAELGFANDDFSFWIEPRLSYHENRSMADYAEGRIQPISNNNSFRYPDNTGSYSEAVLQSASLIIPFSNWYMFLGKDSQQFGAGKHDTLHFSNSAAPFPMVRLGTISPYDSFLGNFSLLTFCGELEPNRHIPRAKFASVRVDWSTSKRVEVGLSRSWMAGGEGQENSFSHVFLDLYSDIFKPTSGIEKYDDFRNQQLVFDFRFKFPEIKTVIYGEFGREDHEFDFDGVIKRWYHTQANILGIKQIDLFFDGFFLILERADTVERYPFPEYMPWFKTSDDPAPAPAAWYNHHQYQSGWTYRGIGLGHHMGADSLDEFFGFGLETSANSIMFFADRETHGVSTVSEVLQEKKREVGVKGFWNWQKNWQLNYLLQKQMFENFGLVADNTVESIVFSTGLKYLF
ncbi:MAG: hypothetical protein HQ517_10030 [SAR324 cluster bacterium]|nr:hypothetical protein [SAR324 cluster bacterium]